MNARDQYTATIGIECHVQLKTNTKLFSAVGNDAREAPPNTLVSHIDFGLPGALPVLNAEAVHLAARAAFALGSVPQKFSKFDRKHYFYPDLPMGYQITQYDEPIILGGSITVDIDGQQKTIGITRAHLEADAGKSTHPAGRDYSLVDLNRAGTPLLEIVSEPDMHTAAEARAYAHELYLRMKYADVSDADLYYGNMRFDVNVSVSKTGELGTRTETKNINSFRAVEKVVEYEINRQIEVLEDGGEVVQETRGWDDAKLRTFSQRTKEDAHDYRYFPDPDLPPIVLTDEYIESVKGEMPVMPDEWRERLSRLGLDAAQTEALLDAEVEFEQVSFLPLLESTMDRPELAKFLANWNVNVFIPLIREGKLKLGQQDHLRVEVETYELLQANKLSSTNAKALFGELIQLEVLPNDIGVYAEAKGYIQQSDEGEILQIVDQVIADNPKAADDVRGGEMKAIGFLVGQVMKASRGKANPALAQQLIKKQLGL
ncbi:MAG TPA: Asp-tRNA(Asn)/Glu-tRNA(Gln) amidotransferase subunit GatB [Candidatus Saccharimonadales bacterium]|nr:Asp-tRNA(Asn)/Glu-tRNA(Gln) amidotransferase subunit GatB [Candidatus Saccharimonadales bacterium]